MIDAAPRMPPKVRRPSPAPIIASPLIAELRAQIDVTPFERRQAAVDAFRATHAATPLIEPDPLGDPRMRVVTFLWRAKARRVLLFVNRLTDETDLTRSLMRHVLGTDLWHLSYRMRDDWIASYGALVDVDGRAPWEGHANQREVRDALDQSEADPTNACSMQNRAGNRFSIVALERAPRDPVDRTGPADATRGILTAHFGPGARRVWVYEPADAPSTHSATVAPAATTEPNPGSAPRRLPVLIVLDGDVWAGVQNLPEMLDRLIANGDLPPVLAVFVDSADRQRRWTELDARDGIVGWLADDLLAWVHQQWPESETEPDRHAVVGQSLGGVSALAAVIRRPDAFGVAIAQSAALWLPEVAAEAAAHPPREARIEVQVGRQEWVLYPPSRDLAAQLWRDGVDVTLHEINGGHDYAWWRPELAAGLVRVWGDAAHD